LEYRRVQDAATARDLAELNMQAYGLPLEMGECICNLHLWKEDSYGYVGYVDGQPVNRTSTHAQTRLRPADQKGAGG
jgi:hypothetical protein